MAFQGNREKECEKTEWQTWNWSKRSRKSGENCCWEALAIMRKPVAFPSSIGVSVLLVCGRAAYSFFLLVDSLLICKILSVSQSSNWAMHYRKVAGQSFEIMCNLWYEFCVINEGGRPADKQSNNNRMGHGNSKAWVIKFSARCTVWLITAAKNEMKSYTVAYTKLPTMNARDKEGVWEGGINHQIKISIIIKEGV